MIKIEHCALLGPRAHHMRCDGGDVVMLVVTLTTVEVEVGGKSDILVVVDILEAPSRMTLTDWTSLEDSLIMVVLVL